MQRWNVRLCCKVFVISKATLFFSHICELFGHSFHRKAWQWQWGNACDGLQIHWRSFHGRSLHLHFQYDVAIAFFSFSSSWLDSMNKLQSWMRNCHYLDLFDTGWYPKMFFFSPWMMINHGIFWGYHLFVIDVENPMDFGFAILRQPRVFQSGIILARRGMNGGSASGGVAASEPQNESCKTILVVFVSEPCKGILNGFFQPSMDISPTKYLIGHLNPISNLFHRMVSTDPGEGCVFLCEECSVPPPKVRRTHALRPTYSGMFGARFSSKLTPQEKDNQILRQISSPMVRSFCAEHGKH